MSERTIRRYIKGDNIVPTKRIVVAILRALNVSPRIYDYAVRQAGITFREGHPEDTALLNVLINMRGASVRDVNNFLRITGFEPLTENK